MSIPYGRVDCTLLTDGLLDEYIAPNDPQHRRWYVVTAGKKVGIWRTWLDISDYVNGVSGNAHQSFKRRAEAEEYYYGAKEAGHVFMLE